MIVVVDYGMGNLHSVSKALCTTGAQVHVTDNPDVVAEADSLVVPGVGAFAEAMKQLKALDLCDAICKHVHSGKPFLGICLGLQILFDVGCEDGEHRGLGLLRGKVVRFDRSRLSQACGGNASLKIPHMGWNQIRIVGASPVLDGLADEDYFYFVHSYYVEPEDDNVVVARTDYGGEFVSAVARDNLFACQFHPEKSQKLGLQILENFVKL